MDDLALGGEGEDEPALVPTALADNKNAVAAAMGEEGEAGLVSRHPRLEPGLEGGRHGLLRPRRAGDGPVGAGHGPQAGFRVGDLGRLPGVRHNPAARSRKVHGGVVGGLQAFL